MRGSTRPRGPELDFVTWTLALVGYLRGLLPGVAAARRRESVVLRYGRRMAIIRDQGAVRSVTLGAAAPIPVEHFDEAGAHDVARSLVGFFDGISRSPK